MKESFISSIGLKQIAKSFQESKRAYNHALIRHVEYATRESRIALKDAKDAMISAHAELLQEISDREVIRASK